MQPLPEKLKPAASAAAAAAAAAEGGSDGEAAKRAVAASEEEGRLRAKHSKWLLDEYLPALVKAPLPLIEGSWALEVATGAARPDTSDALKSKGSGGGGNGGGRGGGGVGGKLPRQMVDQIQERQERAIECLRYFYGCFPLSANTRERAARLHAALVELRDSLQQMKNNLPRDQPAPTTAALQRISPVINLCGAAIYKYETAGQ